METERIKLGETEEQQKILESSMLEGEQVHINHKGCPAGTDTKKRLYIKRTDKGWVAYCHHCSGVGYKLEKEPSIRNVLSLSETCEEPPDTSKRGVDYTQWSQTLSIDGKMYLDQYGITSHDAAVMDIREKDGWICFPLLTGRDYTTALKMSEATVRSVNECFTNVSNATFRNLSHKAYKKVGALTFFMGSNLESLVITEDMLSAYVVMKHGKCTAMPLFGSHLNEEQLNSLRSLLKHNHSTKVYIWLDNDAAGRTSSMQLMSQLSQLGGIERLVMITEPEAKLIPEYARKDIYKWVRG